MEKNYSVEETAKLLGYSRNSIYGFLKDGDIKSVRIGKGKFRIPQSEIDRFLGGTTSGAAILSPEIKKENKMMVEAMVAEAKETSQPSAPGPMILPLPRPGKSLEELGGEPPLYTLKLWFEERVGFPKLFDWFVGLSSIILGIAMFVHSKQVDILLVGRFALWFMPIRVALILSGLGLIIADMIQDEFLRYRNMSNYFRIILFVTYLGLSWILFLGNDIDGVLIYGLFSFVILLEATTAAKSATAYTLYIQALLIGTALIFYFFPADSGLSPISSGLFTILDGFSWIWPMFVIAFTLLALYGHFWERKVLRSLSAFCGILLIILALHYANSNYWDRSFFVLLAGLVGIIVPFWETFKRKFETDRPMVFRMFGMVLMFFSLVVVLIAIIQSILMKDANRNLAEKAEFSRIAVEEVVNGGFSALDGIAQNPLFQNAFKKNDVEGMDSFTKAIFKNNTDLGVVIVIDRFGTAISSYPFSEEIVGSNYSNETFFKSVSGESQYFSRTVEPVSHVSKAAVTISTPIIEKGNIVIGAIMATVNLDALGDRLQDIATSEQDQKVSLVDVDGKWLVSGGVGVAGEKISESDTTNLMWSRTTAAEIGYDASSKYNLFRSSKSRDLGWTVVASEPVFEILNVSRSGLLIVLFLLSVAVLTVSFSFVFSKPRKVE
jgi:excisionase family DNA binding protein